VLERIRITRLPEGAARKNSHRDVEESIVVGMKKNACIKRRACNQFKIITQ